MKKSVVAFVLSSLFVVGCASTHPGQEGVSLAAGPAKIPVKVSAKTIGNAEPEAFQLVDITIENLSDQWVRIHKARVIISDSPQAVVSVVLGRDLKDWAEAMSQREKLQKHNDHMLKSGLYAAGAVMSVAGANSNDENLFNAGALVMVGTEAWAVTDAITSSKLLAERADGAPDKHLYQSFSIPGKMFQRRWLLLNKPTKSLLSSLVVELETVEGVKETYEFKM